MYKRNEMRKQAPDLLKLFLILALAAACLSAFISNIHILFYSRKIIRNTGILAIACVIASLFQKKYNRFYGGLLMLLPWILVTFILRKDNLFADIESQVMFAQYSIFWGLALPFSYIAKDAEKKVYLRFFFLLIIIPAALSLLLCFFAVFRGENIFLLGGRFEFGAQYTSTGRIMLQVHSMYYYHLGYVCVLCFFMTLYLAACNWRRRYMPIWIFLLILFTAGIWGTYSRSGVFAYIGGLLLIFLSILMHLRLKTQTKVLIFVFVTLTALLATILLMNSVYKLVHSIRDIWYGWSTLSSRTDIWASSVHVLRDFPHAILFGFSPGSVSAMINRYYPGVGEIANAHNGYLQILMLTGLPGLFAALGLTFCFASSSLRIYLHRQNTRLLNPLYILAAIPAISIFITLFESSLFSCGTENSIINLISALVCGYVIESAKKLA